MAFCAAFMMTRLLLVAPETASTTVDCWDIILWGMTWSAFLPFHEAVCFTSSTSTILSSEMATRTTALFGPLRKYPSYTPSFKFWSPMPDPIGGATWQPIGNNHRIAKGITPKKDLKIRFKAISFPPASPHGILDTTNNEISLTAELQKSRNSNKYGLISIWSRVSSFCLR